MIDHTTLDFLTDLGTHNTREWMDDNRSRYRAARDDVRGFAADLVSGISRFDPAIRASPPEPRTCVTRLVRDMRFAHGRGPYKTDYYIVVGLQGIQGVAASYAVHLEPGNCFAGGGAPNPRGADLFMYRKKVSDRFTSFSAIVDDGHFRAQFPGGIQCQSGIRRKRIPTGFEPDDPAAEYVKLEGFITREPLPDRTFVAADGLDTVLGLLEGSRPLVDFLNA